MIWDKAKAAIAATKFHAHLDECQQCEAHPFDLCSIGRKLLAGFVAPVGVPPRGRSAHLVVEGETVVGFVELLPLGERK